MVRCSTWHPHVTLCLSLSLSYTHTQTSQTTAKKIGRCTYWPPFHTNDKLWFVHEKKNLLAKLRIFCISTPVFHSQSAFQPLNQSHDPAKLNKLGTSQSEASLKDPDVQMEEILNKKWKMQTIHSGFSRGVLITAIKWIIPGMTEWGLITSLLAPPFGGTR